MYEITVLVKENKEVILTDKKAGNILENDETRLNFNIPNIYSAYNKYLDIISQSGGKKQIILSVSDEYLFSFDIPHELTSNYNLVLQLVLKKENKVFKSNVFCLTFGEGLNVTQFLTSNYFDTLNYLLERKLDKSEFDRLISQLDNKLDRHIYYNNLQNEYDLLNEKADKEYVDDCLLEKVDKVNGKGLSDNNFTTNEKEKLQKLTDFQTVNNCNCFSGIAEVLLKSDSGVYKCSADDELVTIKFRAVALGITQDINYKFELILDVNGENQAPPTVTWQFFKPDTEYEAQLKWTAPPHFDFPRTINKFSFETHDGGNTWIGTQCYSFAN